MSEYDQLEAFRRHLEEKGHVLRVARHAVINRAREVAAIAPKGQKADRDDYTTMVSCGPLYRLAAAVQELDRQHEVVRDKRFEAPESGNREAREPSGTLSTGAKAAQINAAPEVGAPTGAVRQTHTPGPWRYHEADRRWAFLIMAGRGVLTSPVAEIGAIGSENEANARLIAAAPDLLRVVEGLLDVWDPQWEPGKSLHTEAVAVIRKARGLPNNAPPHDSEPNEADTGSNP